MNNFLENIAIGLSRVPIVFINILFQDLNSLFQFSPNPYRLQTVRSTQICRQKIDSLSAAGITITPTAVSLRMSPATVSVFVTSRVYWKVSTYLDNNSFDEFTFTVNNTRAKIAQHLNAR